MWRRGDRALGRWRHVFGQKWAAGSAVQRANAPGRVCEADCLLRGRGRLRLWAASLIRQQTGQESGQQTRLLSWCRKPDLWGDVSLYRSNLVPIRQQAHVPCQLQLDQDDFVFRFDMVLLALYQFFVDFDDIHHRTLTGLKL